MNKYGITKIIKYDQKIKTELFYELKELEKILTTNNYYHELIKEDDITKLFVDIDGNDNIDIDEFQNDLISYLEYLGMEIKNTENKNVKKTFIKYTQNEGKKNSYHITIPLINAKSKNLKIFWINFLKKYNRWNIKNNNNSNIIDLTLYGSSKYFRLPNQNKGSIKENDILTPHIIINGDIKDFIVKYVEDKSYNIDDIIIKNNFINSNNINKNNNDIELEDIGLDDIKKIIKCLSVSRAEKYNDWIGVGFNIYNWCKCKNINHMVGFNLWNDFSMKAKDKYNKDEWDGNEMLNKYYSFENENNIVNNSLRKMAMKDNIDLYNELFNIMNYENIKKEFLKTHFKVERPLNYIKITEEGDLFYYNKMDFVNTYENIIIKEKIETSKEIKTKEISFISKLLKDKNFTTYSEIKFVPLPLNKRNDEEKTYYNSFDGFIIEKDNIINNNINFEDTKIYEHIKNLCNNEKKVYEYFIKWMAQIIQYPDILSNVCLIFRSDEGVGKDTFFNWFGNKILGHKYYLNLENTDLIFGGFNSIYKNKFLTILNESDIKKTKEIINSIKMNVTAPVMAINQKNKDPVKINNYNRFVFLCNNKNCISIEKTDRRFVAIECNNTFANDFNYLKPLFEEMNSGKINNIFYKYLKNINIENYSFTNERPETTYYNLLKEIHAPIEVLFIEYFINNQLVNIVKIDSLEFYKNYVLFCSENGYNSYKLSNKMFSLNILNYEGIVKKKTKTCNVIIIDKKNTIDNFLNKKLISKYDEE